MNHLIYKPNDFYININFEKIKNDLKILYKNVKDCDSIVIINIEDEMQISVNNFGKVELFFDTICEYTSHVAKIENLFKKQISCFNLNI